MSYEVEFTDSAERDLARLHPDLARRIRSRIDALAADPRPHGVAALKGDLRGMLRLRVGDCRVIYGIDDSERLVTIVGIGHRGSVYR